MLGGPSVWRSEHAGGDRDGAADASPAVSVIMPAHNAGRFIVAAVNSVLEQTWTAARAHRHRRRIDRRHGRTGGRVSRRSCASTASRPQSRRVAGAQRGIRIARAPLLAFLDADDEAEPERLATQLAFLAAHHDVDVLGSAISCIDESGRRIGYRSYPLAHEQIVRQMTIANPSRYVCRGGAHGPQSRLRAASIPSVRWRRTTTCGAGWR